MLNSQHFFFCTLNPSLNKDFLDWSMASHGFLSSENLQRKEFSFSFYLCKNFKKKSEEEMFCTGNNQEWFEKFLLTTYLSSLLWMFGSVLCCGPPWSDHTQINRKIIDLIDWPIEKTNLHFVSSSQHKTVHDVTRVVQWTFQNKPLKYFRFIWSNKQQVVK